MLLQLQFNTVDGIHHYFTNIPINHVSVEFSILRVERKIAPDLRAIRLDVHLHTYVVVVVHAPLKQSFRLLYDVILDERRQLDVDDDMHTLIVLQLFHRFTPQRARVTDYIIPVTKNGQPFINDDTGF